MEILRVDNLCKYYGKEPNMVKALDDVSLTIQKGLTAIIGSSGSGKSTLLNLLGGLDIPTKGSVKIRNTNLSIFDDEELTIFRRRNIGFIFQSHNLVSILNVYENIVLPLELDGKSIDNEYIQQIIRMLRLEDRMYDFSNNLSGGQQQRVAIARALSTKPAVILADEPTGSLDSRTSRNVIGLLKMTSKEFNQAIVVITHSNRIADMADQKIYIEDGRIKRREEPNAGK